MTDARDTRTTVTTQPPAPSARPRQRWIARLNRAMTVLIVTAFAAHGVWMIVAWTGASRRINALRADGEPVLPSDFAPVDPDGADNAGWVLRQATDLIDEHEEVLGAMLDVELAPPLRPDERQAIAAALDRYAESLQLLDQARAMPRDEWALDLTSPVILNVMFPKLTNYRALANLLAAGALLDHDRGDDASALRRLDRLVFLSRHTGRHPSLVGNLLGIGIGVVASIRAADIAPDLRIGGGGTGVASPDDVRAVIDLLLDEGPPRESYVRGMRGERMSQVDGARNLGAGAGAGAAPGAGAGEDDDDEPKRPNPAVVYLFKPVVERNVCLMLDYTSGLIPLVAEETWPAARAKLPTPPSRSMLNLLASILTPSLDRALETQFRARTDRRLGAVALAVGWYAAEHNGARPAGLDKLVPRYLPHVPTDPFAPDGRPLAYLPRADAPIVYSVGSNGVDDGGSEEPAGTRAIPTGEWAMRDRVVHLSRRPRPEPAPDQYENVGVTSDAGPPVEPATAPSSP